MPNKLRQKLQDESFITWAQYSNIAGIVVSAFMIAASFYGIKIQVEVINQQIKMHLEQSAVEESRITKLVDTLNLEEKRITVLETKINK
jgi:hypothetical protein